jgi:hypothetical protein|nr:MAG TPA: hypothetical protein [Caudoviricetes sp.]
MIKGRKVYEAAVERNNEKTRIIDGVTECCGYYVGPGVFQVELLNPALFAEGKLKGMVKNDVSIVHKFLATNAYSH